MTVPALRTVPFLNCGKDCSTCRRQSRSVCVASFACKTWEVKTKFLRRMSRGYSAKCEKPVFFGESVEPKKATQNTKILILEFIRFIYEVKKMSEKIYDSLTQLIGKTPLVRLHGFEKLHGLKAHILAKVEYFNPIGSIKDRIVLRIIEDAEKEGKISPEKNHFD